MVHGRDEKNPWRRYKRVIGLIDGVDFAKSRAPTMEKGLKKMESWEREREDEAKVQRDGRAVVAAEEEKAAVMN
ncbi:hypothetical protein S83_013880 [Arachis hypogaea]